MPQLKLMPISVCVAAQETRDHRRENEHAAAARPTKASPSSSTSPGDTPLVVGG
jgi:hypothetical protein